MPVDFTFSHLMCLYANFQMGQLGTLEFILQTFLSDLWICPLKSSISKQQKLTAKHHLLYNFAKFNMLQKLIQVFFLVSSHHLKVWGLGSLKTKPLLHTLSWKPMTTEKNKLIISIWWSQIPNLQRKKMANWRMQGKWNKTT